MGDQVHEETRCAKVGADQCTGVFGGDMPIFDYHSLLLTTHSMRHSCTSAAFE